jgi:hypothetical protein
MWVLLGVDGGHLPSKYSGPKNRGHLRAWLVYQRGLNKQRHKLLSETYQLRGATDPHVFEQWDLKYQRTTAINHATFSRFEYP